MLVISAEHSIWIYLYIYS